MAESSVGCAVDGVGGQADATLLVRDSLDDAPAHRILDEAAQHQLVLAMVEGVEVNFNSPRDALDAGIATVFQDLATIPLMSIWRNFFIGNEIEKGFGPFKWLDVKKMKELTKQELLAMGIDHRVELIFDDIAVYIEINTALGQDAGWVIERIVGVGICVSVSFGF